MQESFEEADLVGLLTGHRCHECGCCLYTNAVNMVWCSNCDYQDGSGDVVISSFVFVPVPPNHPHIKMYGVRILAK